jgi:hypothetical protein
LFFHVLGPLVGSLLDTAFIGFVPLSEINHEMPDTQSIFYLM